MKSQITMPETENRDLQLLLEQGFEKGMDHTAYKALIRHHVEQKTSTGNNTPPSYAEYTALNEHRMKRLEKTSEIGSELSELISSVEEPQYWLILTESWCGDAAQNIPYLEKAASLNDQITTRYLLRDENQDLMNEFLTNNAQAIPKLIAFNKSGKVLFTWGPRPAELQEMVLAYRRSPEPKEPYSEFQKTVQLWYLNNKGQMLQQELVDMMRK